MTIRAKTHLLFPLLALGMTVATAASVRAQGYNQGSSGTSVSLRVTFGTAPHWTSISGTRVEEIRQGERPGYDMFRCGGSYYAYNNNRWYTSRNETGDFTYIDDGSVPTELTMVPREHWRNYPVGWQGRNDQGQNVTSASLRVNFGSAPHWTGINGTRVEEIQQAERPDYDMFRYGGSYYAYNNNRWYTSRNETGDFIYIDDGSVPTELSMVPREHWRNYPTGWQGRNDQGRNDQGRYDQGRYDQGQNGPSGSFEVSFGNQPRWTNVRGTRVTMIRRGQRPGYDMFRYGNRYYVYNNDNWYMSRRSNGRFMWIDDRFVPRELYRVPRENWHSYPTAWQDRNPSPRNGPNGQRR